MEKIQNINIREYTYDLPNERIAKYPLSKRDESKLLIYQQGTLSETVFKNISNYIPENSLLVSNNTRVINARLIFTKPTGASIEIFCLEPHSPSDYALSFAQNQQCQWYCAIGNLKKWKEGTLEKHLLIKGQKATFTARKISTHNDEQVVEFLWNNTNLSFSEIIEHEGTIPIPPYLNREAEDADLETYQTIYSKYQGSVAAPTAGLHFTNEVFNSLANKRVQNHQVTLHVGAGTFKPVKSDLIGDHEMHSEQFFITPETIEPIISYLGNITAVGTTTVRTLESLYWLGVKLHTQGTPITNNLELAQWEVYSLNQNIPVIEALRAILNYAKLNGNSYLMASTAILIAPDYQFKVVNRLITNFHQPKSTLLLLIAAFIGSDWKAVYEYALSNQFRFLSYGDSCFLNPRK